MIVDCGVYRAGQREPELPELRHAASRAEELDGFAWIGLREPTSEEFEEATSQFGLHELLVEDVLKAHQRAKLDRYEDVDFLVFKTARYDEPDRVSIGEIQVIIGTRFVVTVRHGDAAPLSDVRDRLEHTPEHLSIGPEAVLYAVADAVVDAYFPVIDELELDVEQAEQEVFSDDARLNPAERIFGLKRQVLELLRNLTPMQEVLDDLRHPDAVAIHEDLDPYVRDVADHVRRAIGRLGVISDLLSDALSANLAQVSVRQNADMRTISAWAALITVPTMLAGIWGMNFRHMPELDSVFGYPLAILSMAVVVIWLYRRFKRVGWL